MLMLLSKAHVAAYEKKDGTHVADHERHSHYARLFKPSLGVRREDMPQVPSGVKPKFLQQLRDNGVTVKEETVKPDSLKPTQSTFNAANMDYLTAESRAGRLDSSPILVSEDGRVLDGHHRWAVAHLEGHEQPIVRIGLPIDKLLTVARKFCDENDIESRGTTGGPTLAKGGLVLFMKARVGAYLRNGKMVNLAGYDGRQARAQPAPGQGELFSAEEAPPPPAKPNPYKGKDPVLDTPDLFTGATRREQPVAPAAPAARAQEERGNGHEFGELYHGAPVPFDKFDPGKRRTSGAGYDHQGKGFYLTDDPHGFARFFAKEGGAKLAFHLMVQGKEEESNKVADGHGHVMSVRLKPGAKVLRIEDAPDYIRQLFDRSVGNKEVAQELRDSVRKLGYHALNFEEPNFPEGWRTRDKARTTVVYDTDKAEITGSRDAGGLSLHEAHPYWGGHSGPDLDGKHPLQDSHRRIEKYRKKYAEAHASGDESAKFFAREVLEGARKTAKQMGDAFAAFQQHGDGTELSTDDGKRHAILLPDASSPGKYRYQMFDERGFSAHSTHNTPEEAVADAASQGFHVHNPGILDKLAGTDEWAHGMAINAVMQAHNSGQLGWAEAMDKIKALHDEREAKKAGAAPAAAEPAPAAAPDPTDGHPSKPTRSLLNLVPEDRRAEWLDLHKRQHEMHHYDLGQLKEQIAKHRTPMHRALTKLRESEALAKEARKGGDLPGTDERIRLADNAVAQNSIEFQRHSKEVERLKNMHQTVYERVAALGRQKNAIASETGSMDIDWASMKQRAPDDQARHEKTMLAAYRAHYKAKDAEARAAKKAAKAGGTMAKAWDWLGTEQLRGQLTIFLAAAR